MTRAARAKWSPNDNTGWNWNRENDRCFTIRAGHSRTGIKPKMPGSRITAKRFAGDSQLYFHRANAHSGLAFFALVDLAKGLLPWSDIGCAALIRGAKEVLCEYGSISLNRSLSPPPAVAARRVPASAPRPADPHRLRSPLAHRSSSITILRSALSRAKGTPVQVR